MSTPADFTTRARDEIYDIYTEYQRLARRISDLTDEVVASGNWAGIYGASGENWPAQGDGFLQTNMQQAYGNIQKLIGAPTTAEKNTCIRCRRT